MWSPLPRSELDAQIRESEDILLPAELAFWEQLRIDPVKWQLHPWADASGGFWAVGIIGQQVIYYDDIEGDFGLSRYSTHGVIDEYSCVGELHYVVRSLFEKCYGSSAHKGA